MPNNSISEPQINELKQKVWNAAKDMRTCDKIFQILLKRPHVRIWGGRFRKNSKKTIWNFFLNLSIKSYRKGILLNFC